MKIMKEMVSINVEIKCVLVYLIVKNVMEKIYVKNVMQIGYYLQKEHSAIKHVIIV